MTLTTEEAKARLDAYIDRQIAARPIEAKIVRKMVKALKNAGTPVVRVSDWHDEESEDVADLRDVFVQVFNLDECVLHTAKGGVALVMGQDWDMISDYSLNLEEAIQPVNDWIATHW